MDTQRLFYSQNSSSCFDDFEDNHIKRNGYQQECRKADREYIDKDPLSEYKDTSNHLKISIDAETENTEIDRNHKLQVPSFGDSQVLSRNKTWAFRQACKLGLNDDQMIKALRHIEGLSNSLGKVNVLKQTIAKIFGETSVSIIQDDPMTDYRNSMRKSKLTCTICFEDIPRGMGASPLTCDHAYCEPCYRNYLSDKISMNNVVDIKCPDQGCTQLHTDREVALILSLNDYKRYEKLKIVKLSAQNPNLCWCIRPGCGKSIIGKAGVKKVVCECKMELCFNCRQEFHPRKTCEQMQDDTYKRFLKCNDIRRCPQCKSGVEKISGCNHMTCTVCHYEWCWSCGEKYTTDHYSISSPIRCRNLQDGNNARNRDPLWKIYSKRLLEIISFILNPLIFIIMVPNILFEIKRNGLIRGSRKTSWKEFIGLTIVGLLLFPLGILVLAFYRVYSLIQKLNRHQYLALPA